MLAANFLHVIHRQLRNSVETTPTQDLLNNGVAPKSSDANKSKRKAGVEVRSAPSSNEQTSTLKIGELVTFKTHPYLPGMPHSAFCGTQQEATPIMVIVQVQRAKSMEHLPKGKSSPNFREHRYCCMWFSTVHSCFNTELFYQYELQRLANDSPSQTQSTLVPGSRVILSTAYLESQKLSGSYNQHETDDARNSTRRLQSHLSFVPPVMLVLEMIDNGKELSLQAKKDELYQDIDPSVTEVVECKWFNVRADSYSKIKVPKRCLIKLSDPEENEATWLTTLFPKTGACYYDRVINTKRSYGILYKDKSLLKPIRLIVKFGQFYLQAFDLLLNSSIEVSIKEDLNLVEKAIEDRAPKIDASPHDNSFHYASEIQRDKEDLIMRAISQRKHLRVHHRTRHGDRQVVTLKSVTIKKFTESSAGSERGEVLNYLEGTCVKRNETRSFILLYCYKLELLNFPSTKVVAKTSSIINTEKPKPKSGPLKRVSNIKAASKKYT